MKIVVILLSIVLGYVSHPYITKLLIKLKNKINNLVYNIAERIINKNKSKSITKPISTKNKYSTKSNIVKIYNVKFTDRQRHQSDNVIYQLGKKSDIIRISINDKVYYFTSWYYAAKLFKISAITLQTKYANDIKLYTVDNYEVKIDIVLKEDIDNKDINSYKPVGRTNNKVLVKVKNTVSIDECKKKEANIDKDIEEEWKLVHTVTWPQKYYKRGTELYVSNYGRCKEKLNDEEKIYYPQTSCFAGNHINVLVYKNFISDIPSGYVVSYIDGDKSNNHINNLTLISKGDNLHRNQKNAYANNPNYIKRIKIRERGKRCITNGIENKKVRPIDAEYYINNEGWRYGMVTKNTKTI